LFIHTVYFWFDEDLDSQALAAAEEGLQSLTEDPSVHHGLYGKPADTHRSVVDNTYTYGLSLIFEDKAAHDAYQVGEVHKRFLAEHKAKWHRVVVYDIQTC